MQPALQWLQRHGLSSIRAILFGVCKHFFVWRRLDRGRQLTLFST
ncbi:hypothetical protein CTS44_13838 [Comamonas thiooxydans]|nr:hypothetical protein CTS44_13838 [Comamonas thiooxydans]